MDEQLLKETAPCGLCCGKCLAFEGGPIQEHAAALVELLGDNFGQYAERFALVESAFKGYDQFRSLLDYLAAGKCRGCREGGCLFKSCGVAVCVREHGVEFCFECPEFPCDKHGLPERLAELWKRNNQRMKEKGIDTFATIQKTKPRYP